MRIAVNTIFLQKDKLEGYGYFVQEIFSRLAKDHPEHEFIFAFDRPFDERFIFSPNITPIIVSPKARQAISFRYWYDIKLPLALRSFNPDIIVQPYGFCSLNTNTPQLLVLHDLAFRHYPQFIPAWHLFYYRFFTPRFLRKATRIATVSEFSKNDIIQQYGTAAEKIDVVYSAAKPVFQPASYEIQQEVKTIHADGKEYFLFMGGMQPRKNLLNVLKAFSLFKKRQQSNMKLLVAGGSVRHDNRLFEKIKTYKHREDVVLMDYLPEEELAKITASAYAMLFPSFFEGFGVPVVEAMQCGVPVITTEKSSMAEIGTDALLYADPNNPDTIAQQMMAVYKDESLRNELIKKGKSQAAHFSWERSAELLWESILNAVGQARD